MANQARRLLCLLAFSSVAYLACGHVALTFPPARKYDLDFLDNSRTPAPCGMPKGKNFISNAQIFLDDFLRFHASVEFVKHPIKISRWRLNDSAIDTLDIFLC